MAQGAATAGRRLGAATVHHHLPALGQHGERHRVLITDVAGGLSQRGQRQAPRLAGRQAPRRRTLALGQCLLQGRVEQRMP